MADNAPQNIFANPLSKILRVIKLERNEITSIYFYAIINGLIQLSLPLGIQSIISFVLGGTISTSLVVLIFFVVLGVFLNGLLQVNQMRLIEKVQQKIFVRYSFEFAERIPKLNLQAVEGYYLPSLVNRFFDTLTLQKGISKFLLDIPTATIQIIFGLLLLSFYNPVFIFFGLILVLIVYLILKLTGSKGMESSLKESDYKYAVAGWLQEMARVVKSFKFAKHTSLNIEKTDKLVTGYLQSRTTHFKILQWQYWSLIGFKVLITAAMLIVGSILLVNQQLNIGQFIASEIIILMVISSVEKLIVSLEIVYDILTAVEKLSKVTDKPIEEGGRIELLNQNEGLSIQMSQVSFTYGDGRSANFNALKNINLSVEKNEKVCIMGQSGAGKSTLFRLLIGEYKNFSGSLLIDNIPLSNYKLQSVREQTGVLFSQQDIFEGTLLENITMGWTGIPLQQILNIADKIGLKNYISELPQGFNTILDPAGKKMPQRIIQKILLLRALLDNPRLVMLEEPFNGIEESGQQKIIEYLLNDTIHQTLLVISNDEKFASKCDKVIYMEGGTIKAAGKWEIVKTIFKN